MTYAEKSYRKHEARGLCLKMMDEKKDFIVKQGKERLIILIDHWIRHNREHMAEYLRLAERLEPEGLFEIASRIKEASGLILKANDSLSGAKDMLTRGQNESD
ncbi:MAG: hypothetical protein DRH17_06750 [Deltaproteobacteria bacterium]|nr:MAG: hypothetical protein DRH17_06750 [Deltaproteobacteria bacterium]